MRRKKNQHEEHENHERWLVSYADFITLLFAFFVMMYSISSVNEGKYRVLADSMVSAFQTVNQDSSVQSEPVVSKTPITIGQTPKMLAPVPDKVSRQNAANKTNSRLNQTAKSSTRLPEEISASLKKWQDNGQVNIRSSSKWVDIEIGSQVLFRSGSATLSNDAVKILEPLSYQLLGTERPVYVLGYSDNVPIYTAKYASNWELSAARAVSVVNVFTSLGLDPEKMGAIGFGEQRPIADNRTAEGRRKNRRVVIRVFTGDDIFTE